MIKKLLLTVAMAMAALTFMPADQADAQRGARSGGGRSVAARTVARPAFRAGPSARRSIVVRRPVIVRRSVRVIRRPVIVAPVFSSCEWLRRRAVTTGSRYWWRRYYACRGY